MKKKIYINDEKNNTFKNENLDNNYKAVLVRKKQKVKMFAEDLFVPERKQY